MSSAGTDEGVNGPLGSDQVFAAAAASKEAAAIDSLSILFSASLTPPTSAGSQRQMKMSLTSSAL
ncbi:hypothetical protein Slin15195_G079110 [Septoria linicola]|uniref:Uncharacterized protein n=1 Tax=Septoria linicola TaxID=215465 RepID=A0A9Q9ART7_9PEZI|nr:hypothetical protein Slin14017_G040310 [Septoria linicola]USW54592.1 hypothetical protein Slin15195_G079110 [Septoria linicola]